MEVVQFKAHRPTPSTALRSLKTVRSGKRTQGLRTHSSRFEIQNRAFKKASTKRHGFKKKRTNSKSSTRARTSSTRTSSQSTRASASNSKSTLRKHDTKYHLVTPKPGPRPVPKEEYVLDKVAMEGGEWLLRWDASHVSPTKGTSSWSRTLQGAVQEEEEEFASLLNHTQRPQELSQVLKRLYMQSCEIELASQRRIEEIKRNTDCLSRKQAITEEQRRCEVAKRVRECRC